VAGRVWYAAYGSNLARARFRCYLEGGAPAVGQRPHPGARDPSPPDEDRWSTAPHALRFAGRSRRWAGGVAYLDHRHDTGRAHVRLWSLSLGQFEDVLAQECGLAPGEVALDPGGLTPGHGMVVVEGGYGRLLRLADEDGRPVLTCTWIDPRPPAPPGPVYLDLVRHGLSEGSGLKAAEVDAYLRDALLA
jgi:hypothetical protein